MDDRFTDRNKMYEHYRDPDRVWLALYLIAEANRIPLKADRSKAPPDPKSTGEPLTLAGQQARSPRPVPPLRRLSRRARVLLGAGLVVLVLGPPLATSGASADAAPEGRETAGDAVTPRTHAAYLEQLHTSSAAAAEAGELLSGMKELSGERRAMAGQAAGWQRDLAVQAARLAERAARLPGEKTPPDRALPGPLFTQPHPLIAALGGQAADPETLWRVYAGYMSRHLERSSEVAHELMAAGRLHPDTALLAADVRAGAEEQLPRWKQIGRHPAVALPNTPTTLAPAHGGSSIVLARGGDGMQPALRHAAALSSVSRPLR